MNLSHPQTISRTQKVVMPQIAMNTAAAAGNSGVVAALNMPQQSTANALPKTRK